MTVCEDTSADGEGAMVTDAEKGAQGSATRLLSAYGVLALGSIGGQILGFIGLAIVARRVGPQNLGAYGFANSLSGYFALPLMGGMAMVGTRELATVVASRGRTVAEVQAALVLNGVVAYAMLFALAPVLTGDALSRTLIRLTGLALVINALSLDWAMQGLQRLRPLSLYRFLGQVAYLGVLLAVLTPGAAGTERYALCNLLGYSVTAALTVRYVWRRVGARVRARAVSGRAVLVRIRDRASRSFAPAISLVMIQVYYSLDVVLLAYLRGDRAAGEYTTASRLPLAVTAFASLWVTAFYPHAAALFHADRERLRRQVGQFASLSLLVAVPCVPFGLIMGHEIMAALFGRAYAPAGLAFAILLSSAATALVNANVGQILLASGDDRAFLLSVTIGACVNVGLNVVLIPRLGIDGAALATLAAELCVMMAAGTRLTRTVGRINLDGRRLARASIAVAGATAVLLTLRPVTPWWATLAAGAVVYGVLLTVARAVTLDEVRRVVRA